MCYVSNLGNKVNAVSVTTRFKISYSLFKAAKVHFAVAVTDKQTPFLSNSMAFS